MSEQSEPVAVWHYDGLSGIRRSPVLVPDGNDFVLVEGDRREGPFAFADLVAQGSSGGGLQFGLRGQPGWRIGFNETPPAAIVARLPVAQRYGGWIDRIGLWRAVGGFTGLSALVLLGLWMAPALLARMIPRSTEARLGALMVGNFGGRTCSTPEGDAAITALKTRLGEDIPAADVRVVDIPIVNAVALPGGHVLIFRGLLDQATSPDEVAGVLAHEMGHVEHRHVLQALVRQFGLSMVLGGLDGNVGGYTNALLSASYSRSAEAEADGYAIDTLTRARTSPLGAAGFFQRMARTEAKAEGAVALMGYLASHPMSSEREARFSAAAKGKYAPALDAAQWQALRSICRGRSSEWKDELRF
jgi:beta-barrel assembly-enhancing protease